MDRANRKPGPRVRIQSLMLLVASTMLVVGCMPDAPLYRENYYACVTSSDCLPGYVCIETLDQGKRCRSNGGDSQTDDLTGDQLGDDQTSNPDTRIDDLTSDQLGDVETSTPDTRDQLDDESTDGSQGDGSKQETTNPLVALAGNDQTIDHGKSATLTGSATGGSGFYFCRWRLEGDELAVVGHECTLTVSPTGKRIYQLEVLDARTGESANATVTVFVENTGSCSDATKNGRESDLNCGGRRLWINELHYAGKNPIQEAGVELAGIHDFSLDGWKLAFYRADGTLLHEQTLTAAAKLTNSNAGEVWVKFDNGILNTNNQKQFGLALVNPAGAVIQFLSAGGALTAVEGPAIGMRSNDIGLTEDADSPDGTSLGLVGIGSRAEDFVWARLKATRGKTNEPHQTSNPGGCEQCEEDKNCTDPMDCKSGQCLTTGKCGTVVKKAGDICKTDLECPSGFCRNAPTDGKTYCAPNGKACVADGGVSFFGADYHCTQDKTRFCRDGLWEDRLSCPLDRPVCGSDNRCMRCEKDEIGCVDTKRKFHCSPDGMAANVFRCPGQCSGGTCIEQNQCVKPDPGGCGADLLSFERCGDNSVYLSMGCIPETICAPPGKCVTLPLVRATATADLPRKDPQLSLTRTLSQQDLLVLTYIESPSPYVKRVKLLPENMNTPGANRVLSNVQLLNSGAFTGGTLISSDSLNYEVLFAWHQGDKIHWQLLKSEGDLPTTPAKATPGQPGGLTARLLAAGFPAIAFYENDSLSIVLDNGEQPPKIKIDDVQQLNNQPPALARHGEQGFIVSWLGKDKKTINVNCFSSQGKALRTTPLKATLDTAQSSPQAVGRGGSINSLVLWRDGEFLVGRLVSPGCDWVPDPAKKTYEPQQITLSSRLPKSFNAAMWADGRFVVVTVEGDGASIIDPLEIGMFYRIFDRYGRPQSGPALISGPDMLSGRPAIVAWNTTTFAVAWNHQNLIYSALHE